MRVSKLEKKLQGQIDANNLLSDRLRTVRSAYAKSMATAKVELKKVTGVVLQQQERIRQLEKQIEDT